MLIIVCALAGGFTWTLTEYLLHRFVFHNPRTTVALAVEHRKHHQIDGYFTPAREKAPAVVVVVGLLSLSGLWLGAAAVAYTLGFVATYIGYEVFHRAIHQRPPRGAAGLWLRRHHLGHHFRARSSNHGVTSPLWDVVFGSLVPTPHVAIPSARAPRWLFTPSGEPDLRYAADFTLLNARPGSDTSAFDGDTCLSGPAIANAPVAAPPVGPPSDSPIIGA